MEYFRYLHLEIGGILFVSIRFYFSLAECILVLLVTWIVWNFKLSSNQIETCNATNKNKREINIGKKETFSSNLMRSKFNKLASISKNFHKKLSELCYERFNFLWICSILLNRLKMESGSLSNWLNVSLGFRGENENVCHCSEISLTLAAPIWDIDIAKN